MTTRITNEENRRLRWLYKAASKDKAARPILTGLHVTNGAIVATDGYRLQAIETPAALREMDGQTVTPDGLTAKAEEVTFAPVDTDQQFPDYSVLMPKHDPILEIAVNGKMLREALEGMTGESSVLLRFWSPTSPLEVHGKATDESRTYALIMPMSRRRNPTKPWRPK